MSIETTTFTLPSYWASYLINGDASGLNDEEQENADSFLEDVTPWTPSSVEGESFFSNSNDAGTLPGDCLEYTFFKS